MPSSAAERSPASAIFSRTHSRAVTSTVERPTRDTPWSVASLDPACEHCVELPGRKFQDFSQCGAMLRRTPRRSACRAACRTCVNPRSRPRGLAPRIHPASSPRPFNPADPTAGPLCRAPRPQFGPRLKLLLHTIPPRFFPTIPLGAIPLPSPCPLMVEIRRSANGALLTSTGDLQEPDIDQVRASEKGRASERFATHLNPPQSPARSPWSVRPSPRR